MTMPLCVNLCVDLLLTCYSHSFGHTGPPVRASISYRRTAQVWSGTALLQNLCVALLIRRGFPLRFLPAELESSHPMQLGEAPL